MVATSCDEPDSATAPLYGFTAHEQAFDARYLATDIELSGRVVDQDGRALEGASVRLIGWGQAAANDARTTECDAAGRFRFTGLIRRSVLACVQAPEHYDEVVAVDLQRPIHEAGREIEPTVLVRRRAGTVRFLFGGDTMIGRRYLDRDGDGVMGEAEDLVWPESLAEDAVELFRYFRDTLVLADYTMVNLETPITDGTGTAHPYKPYKFFSYPGILEALGSAGIDGVSLGNNHVFDYLDGGVEDTLLHVGASGLDWFGAGMNETDAKATVLHGSASGVDFAMQGFDGIRHIIYEPGMPPWPPEYLYVASDPDKPGALELTRDNVCAFLEASRETRFSIPVLHGGLEYGEYPSPGFRSQIVSAIDSGAGIVVAHHPHTAHGIGVRMTPSGPRFAFLSLGNLLFDQNTLETFRSFVAVVDVEQISPGSHRVNRIRLTPYHIEGYVPKPLTADWRDRLGRHVGHLSTYLPERPTPDTDPDGLAGAVVFPAHNQVVVCGLASQYRVVESTETFPLCLDGDASAPIPFQRRSSADGLGRIEASLPVGCDCGRDILNFGDFEDFDVDDEYSEGALWDQSPARFVENSVVHAGTGALVLLRRDSNRSTVSAYLKNKVTFGLDSEGSPAKLTLVGYMKAMNTGEARVDVRWYDRESSSTISTEVILSQGPQTNDWSPFIVDLNPPTGAGSVRIYFRQDPPQTGEGRLFIDDVQLIQWEAHHEDARDGIELRTPNNWSWIRFRASEPMAVTFDVCLTHRCYRLVGEG